MRHTTKVLTLLIALVLALSALPCASAQENQDGVCIYYGAAFWAQLRFMGLPIAPNMPESVGCYAPNDGLIRTATVTMRNAAGDAVTFRRTLDGATTWFQVDTSGLQFVSATITRERQ